MCTALLIIDVQQALCSGVGEVFEAARVIENINLAEAKARDARVLVVLIQHETDEGSFVYGSLGWQLADGLGVEPSDIRIRKRAPDSFHRAELKELLEQHNIDRLVICGLHFKCFHYNIAVFIYNTSAHFVYIYFVSIFIAFF